MRYKAVLDIINTGIVIIDRHYKVLEWNRWMSFYSKIERKDIIDLSLFQHYPNLNKPSFLRVCKSVFTFGNIIYLSQKIHSHLFPFKVIGSHSSSFEFMQQSCNISPLKDEDGKIEFLVISIQDVTESVVIERRLRNLNSTDGLTGAYNRRYFEARIKEEFFRLKRYELTLSLLMFDIDNFKKINDTYGHQFGDYVLKKISMEILELIRDVDILIRFGGDEFICFLPETNIMGAYTLGERIRKTIEKTCFSDDDKEASVSISIGTAEVLKSMTEPEQLIEAADQALYTAKNAGRNCTKKYSAEEIFVKRESDSNGE
ncbi:MAG: sensor domain-containing diguanylate cyclase [Spirochaetales bacterium]|nr:sensor domain-containing diguanylate cyclase [Spirochaetales bacterium]